VNTWRGSYFETEGTRVLVVLPQSWTERFIPMQVSPRPKQIVRVMVGRLEALTPARERLAEAAVRDLASPDAGTRGRAFDSLREEGRYVEPILRRLLRTTQDDQVRTLCRRLLLTDFVTELRAAIHSATDGRRVEVDPLHVRAQLASLLREIGLNAEARAEAAPVYAALQQIQAPPMDKAIARHYLRAYARTMEGMGNDEGAAEWYGKFVRWGSRVKQCGGCHWSEGPRDMAWFRDWWAGKKLAQYETRLGRVEKSVAMNEAALKKNPGDTGARLTLAYLYEARQEKEKAAKMWAALEAPAVKSRETVATMPR
jgi:tetratricopeptide (TPR) repeat protein